MDFQSIFQVIKNVYNDIYSFFSEIFIDSYIYIYENINIVIILSILIIILSLILIYMIIKDKKYNYFSIEDSEEYLKIDYKFKVLEISEKFCNYLDISKEDIINSIKNKYFEFFELFSVALKEKKSFIFAIKDKPINMTINFYIDKIVFYLNIDYKNILYNLPIPLSIDLNYKKINNNCFNNFGTLQSAEFFFKGQFFLKHSNIFKREIANLDNINYSILIPVMKQEEYTSVSKRMYDLPPLSICILNRSGEIFKQSNEFKKFFNINQDIFTFQDFLESIRNHILHDEIFFTDFKKYFLNLISQISNLHEETYSTIDGKVILFRFIPNEDKIYFLLEDITNLSINKTQEYLFKDLKTKLFPSLSDFVLIIDAHGIVESSNCELIPVGEKINTAKTVLKFFTTSENTIQEINLSNNGKCLFVKISIKEKIFKVKNYIVGYLDKIIKILNLLNNTIDGSLNEYLKYIKFIAINIENNVKILELGINRNYNCSNFDLISIFNSIKEDLEQSFVFKNLNIVLNVNSINVFNHKESISLFIESLLLIAFKYQFNQKNFLIEEKNEKIYVTLDGINKEELDKVYSMFDLISNVNIFSNIREIGDKISIGFYFDKVKH